MNVAPRLLQKKKWEMKKIGEAFDLLLWNHGVVDLWFKNVALICQLNIIWMVNHNTIKIFFDKLSNHDDDFSCRKFYVTIGCTLLNSCTDYILRNISTACFGVVAKRNWPSHL